MSTLSTSRFVIDMNVIKTTTLDKYKEDREFLKSWYIKINLYFKLHATQFLNEAFKVMFVIIYLKKAILDWIQSRVNDYLNNFEQDQEEETQQLFFHVRNLIEALKITFEKQNENRIAKRKLLILRQTKSMTTYATQFKTLAFKIDWEESILKVHFYKSLNDKVKNVMMILKMSNILHTMIEATTRIDIKQYERYIDKQVKIRIRLTKERRFMKDSMKLDVIEKKELRIKSCYFCESKRHLKRNCSKKTIEIIEEWITIIEKVSEASRKSITNEIHAQQHYSACYTNECEIHLSNKQRSKW